MYERSAGGKQRGYRRQSDQCGSKGGSSAYDPQVGEAANQSAATAQQAQQWTENYYNTELTPALNAETQQAATAQAQQTALFNINDQEATAEQGEFNTYGLPAQTNYYNMVDQYSAPAMEQQQAEAALGDQKTAEASQQTTFNQGLGAAGVSSSSPAAIQAEASMGVNNAANEAAAETRARNAAQQLGIQLTSDAVNVASGGASQIVNSSTAAGNASSAALGATATNTGSATNAASPELQAANIATDAYGNNLNAYSRLGAADIQASAQADQGLGTFLGSVLAAPTGAGSVLGALGLSDRRLKKNIKHVGRLDNGLNVYTYDFRAGGPTQMGVMADEVRAVIPDAVVRGDDGYDRVDYAKVA